MVSNYNTFNTSIGRISIEPTLENATAYGGAIPLLDYIERIQLTDDLEEHLLVSKQGGTFPLNEVATALIIGRLLGIERISHFEEIEEETLLKRFFKWDKLPDYTTYYNDLQRFENLEDVEGLKETNEELTERILSKQDHVILDFDSSVNRVFGYYDGALDGYDCKS